MRLNPYVRRLRVLDATARYHSDPHRNRYLTDDEVDALFAGADAVILPYRRCSQSGTLHVAMHYGLPVVVTSVGGLVEAVAGYGGAVLAEPANAAALGAALRRAADLRGQRFAAPRTWAETAQRYHDFFPTLAADRGTRGAAAQS